MMFVPAKCPSCGGDIQVPQGRDTIICMYCGTRIIVANLSGTSNRVLDDRTPARQVAYCEPYSSPEQARTLIQNAVKAKTSGCLVISAAAIKIERIWFPVWKIDAQIHCTWNGRYRRDAEWVRRWATPTGHEIAVPTSGAHDFAFEFLVPATHEMSKSQIDELYAVSSLSGSIPGEPSATDTMGVIRHSIEETDVWERCSCDSL